jgi:hypothetical protein
MTTVLQAAARSGILVLKRCAELASCDGRYIVGPPSVKATALWSVWRAAMRTKPVSIACISITEYLLE